MKRILFAVLLMVAVPGLALASDQGVYFTADIGAAKYSNVGEFPNPAKVGLGAGYKFNRYLAADLGLTIFGDSTIESFFGDEATLSAHSIYPSLVGILPITPEFSVFGKLGFSSNHAEIETNYGYSAKTSNTSVYYGLGLEYLINPKLGLRALYENFGKFESGSPAMSATAFSLGIIVYLQ